MDHHSSPPCSTAVRQNKSNSQTHQNVLFIQLFLWCLTMNICAQSSVNVSETKQNVSTSTLEEGYRSNTDSVGGFILTGCLLAVLFFFVGATSFVFSEFFKLSAEECYFKGKMALCQIWKNPSWDLPFTKILELTRTSNTLTKRKGFWVKFMVSVKSSPYNDILYNAMQWSFLHVTEKSQQKSCACNKYINP